MLTSLTTWYDRRRGARSTIISWLATRLLILTVLVVAERFVVGDVFYYHRKIAALFTVGLDDTLYEYPTPVVWLLWLPYGASFGSRVGYLIAFIAVHAGPGRTVHPGALRQRGSATRPLDRLLARSTCC